MKGDQENQCVPTIQGRTLGQNLNRMQRSDYYYKVRGRDNAVTGMSTRPGRQENFYFLTWVAVAKVFALK